MIFIGRGWRQAAGGQNVGVAGGAGNVAESGAATAIVGLPLVSLRRGAGHHGGQSHRRADIHGIRRGIGRRHINRLDHRRRRRPRNEMHKEGRIATRRSAKVNCATGRRDQCQRATGVWITRGVRYLQVAVTPSTVRRFLGDAVSINRVGREDVAQANPLCPLSQSHRRCGILVRISLEQRGGNA